VRFSRGRGTALIFAHVPLLPVSFTKRALTESVRPTSTWKVGSASSAASVGRVGPGSSTTAHQ
jgi:hypothetical protein